MEGVLEVQRRAHEELDELEEAIVNELIEPAPTHKARLFQETTAANLLRQISLTAQHLDSLYADADLERQKDIEKITIVDDEFGNFYSQLKAVKDAHRRYPTERLVDDSEFQALLLSSRPSEQAFDALFSGEETFGKYLDLTLAYERYINLKNVRRLDYIQFLGEFDNFEAIPAETKLTHAYSRYLDELESYFCRFFAVAKPLMIDFSVSIRHATIDAFERLWAEAKVPGWEEAAKKDQNRGEGIFCAACAKLFTNQSVYQAHLGGRKHIKALQMFENKVDNNSEEILRDEADAKPKDGNGEAKPADERPSTAKTLALKESLIAKYAKVLGNIREETRSNVERKQSRTLDEREEDVVGEEDEPIDLHQEEATSEGGAIYNPKNLPLDWDGKPIPYWLWKLHGLGVRFPCEICGNHLYMGRKAFDQHFFEWRHSNGMKALGIPNTKHFFQITRIEEAQRLWDKLKQASRTDTFRPEAMEEFEDHLGNVYNRKTYEDLRRQGLI